MKIKLGPSDKVKNPEPKPGHSVWLENGVWYEAPTVDPAKYGPHQYRGGIGHCECGCYMGGYDSCGPVDPFGACPSNPNPFAETAT